MDNNHQDKNGITNKTIESVMWYTSLPLVMQVVRFVNSIVLARLLDPKDFGIIGIASVLIYYCNNLSSFGLGNAIVQKKDISIVHIHSFFTFNLGISILLGLLFVTLRFKIATFFNVPELEQVLLYFPLLFFISAFYAVAYTQLRRAILFKHLAFNEATRTIVSVCVSLTLALNGFHYWSLLIATLAADTIAAITINIRAAYVPKLCFKIQPLTGLINFAMWNFISLQIRVLSEYIDKIFVGKILGVVVLGFYEKSFGLSKMPNEFLSNKISSIAFSVFSSHGDDKNELKHVFKRMVSFSSFLILPVYIGLFSVSDHFVHVLLGEKWVAMIVSFKILLISFCISSLSSLFSTANITCGSYKTDIKFRALSVGLLLVFLVISVRFGIEVVASMVLLHNIIYFLMSLNLVKKTLDIDLKCIVSTIAPAITGSFVMFVVLFVLKDTVATKFNAINLLSLVVVGFVVYAIWFLWTDFEDWKFIKNKIRKRYYTYMGIDRGL